MRKDLAQQFKGAYPVPTYVGEFLLGRYCATTDRGDRRGSADRRRLLQTGPSAPARRSCSSPAPARGARQADRPRHGAPRRQDERPTSRPAEPPTQGRAHRRRACPRQRADADRRLLRRGRARLRRGDRAGEERPPVRHRSPARRSSSRREVLWSTSPRAAQPFTTDGVEATSCSAASASSRSASRQRAQDVLLLRMVPFVERNYNMVELGPRGTGKSPPVPAGLAVRPSRLRRQGDGRPDVRQQRHRPARTGLPVRRRLLRRGLRRLLRPEGRRQHHEGLHGVRRVQPRQGEHPRRRRHRAWSATSTWTSQHQQRDRPSASARCRRRCGTTPRSWTASTPTCPAGTCRSSTRRYFTDHFGLVSDFLAECWTPPADAEPARRRSRAACIYGGALSGRDTTAVNKTVDGLLKLLYPEPEMRDPGRGPRVGGAPRAGVPAAGQGAAEADRRRRVPQHAVQLPDRRTASSSSSRRPSCRARTPSAPTRCRRARSGRLPGGGEVGRRSVPHRSSRHARCWGPWPPQPSCACAVAGELQGRRTEPDRAGASTSWGP